MKLFSFKKSMAILVTLALIIGLFSAIPTISAEPAGYYGDEVTVGTETTANLDNWTIIEGSMESITTAPEKSGTAEDSYNFHLKTREDENGKNGYAVDRVQAKTPANARITNVSFTVRTRSTQARYPLEVIYDYESLDSYTALGLTGNGTKSQLIYKRTASSYTGTGTDLKVTWDEGSEHGSNYTNTFTITIKYNYAEDGTATAILSIVKVSGGSPFPTATLTNYSLGTVSNPCVILSGGSNAGMGSDTYSSVTGIYGQYKDISYTYQPFVDITEDVADFKTANPLPDIDAMTYETAIADGRAANTVIEAVNAVTDANLKSALADYAAQAEVIVEKANIYLESYYSLDFSDTVLLNNISNLEGTQIRGGSVPTSYVDNVYTYENGIMKFVQTTGTNSLAGASKGTNVRMIKSVNGKEISKVTAKVALEGGGKWNPLKINLGTSGTDDNGRSIDIYYAVDSSTGKLTQLNLRVNRPDANAAYSNDKTATSEDVLATAAPDVSDPSTYFTLEYTVNSSGYPTAILYSANGTELANVPANDKLYDYTGINMVGFGSVGLTAGYVDDVKIWYDGSETFVAPEMQGASIVKTDEFDKQDLRFEINYDTTAAITSGYTPYEYGVMLMTNSRMPANGLLEMTSVGELALDVIIASAKVEEGGTVPATFYAELSGTAAMGSDGTFNSSLVGKRFVARPYVAYKNDTTGELVYAYGGNDIDTTSVENGQASKSVIGVAKAIAEEEIANATSAGTNIDADGAIAAIIAQTTTTTNEQRTSLLTFVCENIAYLN